MSKREPKELLKLLGNMGLPLDDAQLKRALKRHDFSLALDDELEQHALNYSKTTPEYCLFQYVAEGEEIGGATVLPLRDARADQLRYSEECEPTVLDAASSAEQVKALSPAQRLYALFEAGTIGCALGALKKPHVSNCFLLDHAKRAAHPLSSTEAKALLGPVLCIKAARNACDATLQGAKLLQTRRRLAALLDDAGMLGDEVAVAAAEPKSKKSKKKESSSSSSSSSEPASSSSESSGEKKRKRSKKSDKKSSKKSSKKEKKSSSKKEAKAKKLPTSPKKATPPQPVPKPLAAALPALAAVPKAALPLPPAPKAAVAEKPAKQLSESGKKKALKEAVDLQRKCEVLADWFENYNDTAAAASQ